MGQYEMNQIYRLTFKSGKVYIGQTVRGMHIRLSQHRTAAKRGSKLPIHAAWRKHGEPDVEIIMECATWDELNAAEVAAIADHNSIAPNGYNMAYGGNQSSTKNPDVAKKISVAATGRKHPPRPAMAEAATEMWKDPEYRGKVSAAGKAKWADPEYRAAMSEKRKAAWAKRLADGWAMPDETKAKLSARVVSDETKAKMADAAKRRVRKPMSAETKAKIAAATKRQWADATSAEKLMTSKRDALANRAASQRQEISP